MFDSLYGFLEQLKGNGRLGNEKCVIQFYSNLEVVQHRVGQRLDINSSATASLGAAPSEPGDE